MASPHNYMRYVLPHHGVGWITTSVAGDGPKLFQSSDCPEKWNMKKGGDGVCGIWTVGYIWRSFEDVCPCGDGGAVLGVQPQPKYWWCRDADWLPYWGEATKLRADICVELRAYWVDKWFGTTVPEIKRAILETTKLVPDIVEELPQYFEYPYEIKYH